MKRKRSLRYLVWLLVGVFCLAGLCSCQGLIGGSSGSKTPETAFEEEKSQPSEAEDMKAVNAGKVTNDGGASEKKDKTGTGKAQKKRENVLEVHYIDVGQGDATLILQNGHAMLIDAGNNSQGTKLQAYFRSLGIKKFDYIVGTHADADHIGGLDVILYKFDCDKVLMYDSEKETRTYEDVVVSLQSKDMKKHAPVAGETYPLGEAEFTIVSPVDAREYDDSNSSSIGILLQYGKTRFLFTGDAEEDAEKKMVQGTIPLKADVFKAAHHGSDTANTEEFLEAVSPEYAVISCGEGNSYGHPHAEVIDRFRKLGIKIFRTDEQGTIVAVSDGKKITFHMSPSESYQSGERTRNASEDENLSVMSVLPGKGDFYILNTNTKRFHLPDCYSVKDIKPEHKEERKAAAKQLQEEGYQGCGNCIGRK